MKTFLKCTLIATLFFIIASCTSTKEGYNSQRDFSRFANLGEAIRSVGGMQVTGGNTMAGFNDAVVNMRGQASLVLNTQPLYVVDNVPVGNNYNVANNLVHPSNIVSIRVVRGTSASTIYGEDANHGAIIIRTKSYEAKRGGPTG